MITLIRDGIVMKVATELQASVFLRAGYKRVEKAPGNTPADADASVKRNFATEAKETAPKAAEEPGMPVKGVEKSIDESIAKDAETPADEPIIAKDLEEPAEKPKKRRSRKVVKPSE